MDAVSAAHHQFELQRQMFIYGDIKSEMLTAFRGGAEAFVYLEDGDEVSYIPIDVSSAAVYDDKMSGSFKVGDNFQCLVRENSKEIWFQIMYGVKKFINLRDPEKYFRREEPDADYFIFVQSSGISIVMINRHAEGISKAAKLLKKMARSIIGYDKHGSAYVKRGVK